MARCSAGDPVIAGRPCTYPVRGRVGRPAPAWQSWASVAPSAGGPARWTPRPPWSSWPRTAPPSRPPRSAAAAPPSPRGTGGATTCPSTPAGTCRTAADPSEHLILSHQRPLLHKLSAGQLKLYCVSCATYVKSPKMTTFRLITYVNLKSFSLGR